MTAKEIIAEERSYWEQQESGADPNEQYKFGGATRLFAWLKWKPRTLKDLRAEHAVHKERAAEEKLSDRDLDIMARNRAVFSMKAIQRLGKRLKEVDRT